MATRKEIEDRLVDEFEGYDRIPHHKAARPAFFAGLDLFKEAAFMDDEEKEVVRVVGEVKFFRGVVDRIAIQCEGMVSTYWMADEFARVKAALKAVLQADSPVAYIHRKTLEQLLEQLEESELA